MIHVEDLSFRYPRAAESAVEGLGFSVRRGEIFGLLGPNGAGKSTTQKILVGLLRDYSGGVSVMGRPLGDWGPDYYEHVGVVFEFPNHFLKLTGAENLLYFRALYRDRTLDPQELLDRVGLTADGDTPVSQYSKGMKHRLSVARALLNDPELLFLDEPTAGLDPASGRAIKELLCEQRRQGKTLLLTTHDMAAADELCDRVAFIVDGKIALIETPRTLRLGYGERRVRVEFRVEGQTRQQEYSLSGLAQDAGFFDLLRTGDVQTIHTLEATLEDVFIRVTGRSLE